MLAAPHTSSGIHHHGPQDTIVYAVRGKGSIVFADGKEKVEMKPGDFALIPSYAAHQECNDGDDEVEWVIVRGGKVAEVVNTGKW